MKNWIALFILFSTTVFGAQILIAPFKAQASTTVFKVQAQTCSDSFDIIVVWHVDSPVNYYMAQLHARLLGHTLPSNSRLIRVSACDTFQIYGESFMYQDMNNAVGTIHQSTGAVGTSDNYAIQNPDLTPTYEGGTPQTLPVDLFSCDTPAGFWLNRSGPNYAVKIAILDTGLDTGNRQLTNYIGSYYNCLLNATNTGTLSDIVDSNGHGSIIASIYYQRMETNDQYDIYKILDSKGKGYVFDAIVGIDTSTNRRVDIINASFTARPMSGYYSAISPLSIAIDEARKVNILFLAASGNDTLDIDLPLNHTVPVGEPNSNILGTGAYNYCSEQISSYSNWGKQKVHIFSCGDNLNVWNHQGFTIIVKGTSFANAVTGLGILQILQKQVPSTRNYETLRDAIINSATYNESLKNKCVSQGLLNVSAAACLLFKDCHTRLNVKVMLQGPYNSATQVMNDQLRALNLIPLSEPYTQMFDYRNGNQNETTTNLALNSSRPKVDWVLLELRDPNNSSKILFTRAALLTVNGDVVDTDGISPVDFDRTQGGSFYVAVRHRNHLGIRTASPVTLTATPTILNFVNSSVTPTYGGTSAQKVVGSNSMMWAGDSRCDGNISYTGFENDNNAILSVVGLLTPNNIVSGYNNADLNMDGFAKYIGAANDKNVILFNVGLFTPNNIIYQK